MGVSHKVFYMEFTYYLLYIIYLKNKGFKIFHLLPQFCFIWHIFCKMIRISYLRRNSMEKIIMNAEILEESDFYLTTEYPIEKFDVLFFKIGKFLIALTIVII